MVVSAGTPYASGMASRLSVFGGAVLFVGGLCRAYSNDSNAEVSYRVNRNKSRSLIASGTFCSCIRVMLSCHPRVRGVRRPSSRTTSVGFDWQIFLSID